MIEQIPQPAVTYVVRLEPGRNGRKLIRKGRKPKPSQSRPSIRVSRAMALALRFETLLKEGLVRDYSDFATLAAVDRSLITRLMNLRLLAPRIQEHLLSLESKQGSFEVIFQKDLMPLARTLDWNEQIRAYTTLCNRRCPLPPFTNPKDL
jgi:hypothetical protein